MEELTKYLKRRLQHVNERVAAIEERHGDNPTEKGFNYHGGRSLWQGRQNALEDIIDHIANEEEKK